MTDRKPKRIDKMELLIGIEFFLLMAVLGALTVGGFFVVDWLMGVF